MKKVLIDLNHPVDVNFFKNAIKILINSGINIDVIYRDRGKLKDISIFELPVKPIKKGKHYNSFLTKIFGQLRRDFNLYFLFKEKKYDIIACFGSTSVISAWMSGTPFLAFDDDFEYKIPFYHANLFATRHIYPDFISYERKNVVKYHGYKELAYLHPKYFKPNLKIIQDLDLLENDYIFIRHISNISLNYKDANDSLLQILNNLKVKKLKVILSIEDKSLINSISSEILVLNEPLTDIYSLMYYALMCISYGDTVARECSLLGVPTVYVGGRNMSMHNELIGTGVMMVTKEMSDINRILVSDLVSRKNNCRSIISQKIDEEWCDTTELILSQINNFL